MREKRAPLSLADAVVAIMRDPKVKLPPPFDCPVAPTPPPEGAKEEMGAPHDSSPCVAKDVDGRVFSAKTRFALSPGHDENRERAPVERPWIPAAVRAQMGHIDPRFPVARIIETEWPDERAARAPRLQERAYRSPREAEEGGW